MLRKWTVIRMDKASKILLASAILAASVTVGAYAASSGDGAHDHDGLQQPSGITPSGAMSANDKMTNYMPGHEGMQHGNMVQHEQSTKTSENTGNHTGPADSHPQPTASDAKGNHGTHDAAKSSAGQGPDWPVIYGFGGVNLAILIAAALNRYVLKADPEVHNA